MQHRAANDLHLHRLRVADHRRDLPIARPPMYPPGSRSPGLVTSRLGDQGPGFDDPMYPPDPLAPIDPPAQCWVDIPVDELPRSGYLPVDEESRRLLRSPRLQASINRMASELLARDAHTPRTSSHTSSHSSTQFYEDISPPGPVHDWTSSQNP